MASGIVGSIKPSAAAYKTAYKPASGTVAVVSVSVCNQASSDDTFRMGIVISASTDPTPSISEFVAFSSLIKASGDTTFADRAMFGPYELNGTNNNQVVVYSGHGDTSFVITGDEGTV